MKGVLEKVRSGTRMTDSELERWNAEWRTPEPETKSLSDERRVRGLPWEEPKTFSNFVIRPGTETAYEAARDYAERVALGENPGWLVLQGVKGSGKSHLAMAIVDHLVTEGVRATRFWEVVEFLDCVKKGFDDSRFEGVLEEWCRVSLMVLDDLGQEQATEWSVPRLGLLLNERYKHRRATVITTNLDMDALRRHHGTSRIADRVFDIGTGLCYLVELKCDSYRTGRTW